MKIKSTIFCLLLAVAINNFTTAKAQVDVQDSLALVDLYNSTSGPLWYNHDNWLTGPVATWYGISVVDTRVTAIYLDHNKLNDSLPQEIGNLSKLSDLDLSGNQLTGIPLEIGNLSNLSNLWLSGNQLTSIPPEIGNLPNLYNLWLDDNQLTSLPSEIGNLSNLTFLVLYNNQLSSLPPEIGSLSSLNTLYLFNNKLTSLPPEIGSLSNLTSLQLYNNQLGSLPPEIGNLSDLTVLSLEYNQLTSLPPEIGNLPNLFDLELSDNQLTSLPAEIGSLSSLNTLYLFNNKLTSLPPEIGDLRHLHHLYLYSNQLTSIPPEIGNLSNLTILHLSGNQLTNLPAEIGNLTFLKFLDLSNNQLTSLPVEIENVSNLKYLYLHNNRLMFTSLENILKKFNNIRELYYSPQANILLHQNSNSLFVSAGGALSYNTYNWYKVGEVNPITIAGDSVFYPREHGKYYAAVTNSICSQLTLYTDTVDYVGVLPVTLINLKAQQLGGMVKVEWTSVTEINIDRYEIQRAADAQNFVGIGSLPAKGNGTQRINYSFNDVKPLQGSNYYRLKAFDKDGAITFSNMVLVKMNSDKVITLIYPNPVKNILNIQKNGNASFSLINQSGKVILTKAISNCGVIDVSHYAAGLYYLKNNSTGEVQKIIVVK